MILRRIDPLSAAKMYAVISAVVLFVFALPMGCITSMVGSLGSEYGDAGGFGAGLGFFMLILYPILGLIVGFISGFLMAWVYNLVADRIGGVELEFDQGYLGPAHDDLV